MEIFPCSPYTYKNVSNTAVHKKSVRFCAPSTCSMALYGIDDLIKAWVVVPLAVSRTAPWQAFLTGVGKCGFGSGLRCVRRATICRRAANGQWRPCRRRTDAVVRFALVLVWDEDVAAMSWAFLGTASRTRALRVLCPYQYPAYLPRTCPVHQISR